MWRNFGKFWRNFGEILEKFCHNFRAFMWRKIKPKKYFWWRKNEKYEVWTRLPTLLSRQQRKKRDRSHYVPNAIQSIKTQRRQPGKHETDGREDFHARVAIWLHMKKSQGDLIGSILGSVCKWPDLWSLGRGLGILCSSQKEHSSIKILYLIAYVFMWLHNELPPPV